MLGAGAQDFRREHLVDLKELEFHGVAAAIRRRIHKGQRPVQMPAVIAGCFRNEDGLGLPRHRIAPFSALTISKAAVAKRWLTGAKMAHETQSFFIVSSGRSGTAMLHKVLSSAGDIEMHHEYMVQITQKLAVQRYQGLVSAGGATQILRDVYASAVRCSPVRHWGDSSNKASWLIAEIAALLPEAKFVHLTRDGRKVAGSYHRKLFAECYDDRSTAILQAFLDDPANNPAPPPEKKYWWPIGADPAFRTYDQFERIAWHWGEVNRVIFDALAALPPERSYFARLEDLYVSPSGVKGLFHFLNLPYRDEHFAMFARPHNVNRPDDELLTPRQAARFDAIAGAMMARLGYADREEYVVNY
jgi:hypothetical protein